MALVEKIIVFGRNHDSKMFSRNILAAQIIVEFPKMSIRDELFNHLQSARTRDRANGDYDRNIKVVLGYYGFLDHEYPTYDELGVVLKAGSRQRVHQIMDTVFRSQVNIEHLPLTRRCAAIINGRPFWRFGELSDTLHAAGMQVSTCNVRGIIRLLHELGQCQEFDVYDRDLKSLAKIAQCDRSQCVLVHTDHVDDLRSNVKMALDGLGRVGIANFSELARSQAWSKQMTAFVFDSLSGQEGAWLWSDGNDTWHANDARESTLHNFIDKIFTVTLRARPEYLVDVIDNAFRFRTIKGKYPPKNVLLAYLSQSHIFIQENGDIRLASAINAALSDIEKAIVEFFAHKDSVGYNDLRDHLLGMGFSSALVSQKITKSCIVHVDRTKGRGKYLYSLVGR